MYALLSAALKFRVEEMYNDSHDENKAKGGFSAAAQITLLSREKNLNNIKRSFQAFSLKKTASGGHINIFYLQNVYNSNHSFYYHNFFSQKVGFFLYY